MVANRPPPAGPTLVLHRDALVVDTHAHAHGFLPKPAGPVYRRLARTMPPDVDFAGAARAGVDALVAKAVGDRLVTLWYRTGPWQALVAQLDAITTDAARAGGVIATTVAGVRAARAAGRLAVLLGVEGADPIGDDLDRIDDLAGRGVRVIVPVHLGDNQVGTTCLPALRYVGPVPVRRRRARGLTPFGAAAIRRMQDVGIVVDVSHADDATVHDVVDLSRSPVIASHAGARAVADFERFLTDDELRAVAATGGVVGLWPFHHGGKGVPTLADLIAHARHVAGLVGPQHLCVGTDMNGVPGLMEGYRGEADLPLVTGALLDADFSPSEVRGILGENFLRVLAAAAG